MKFKQLKDMTEVELQKFLADAKESQTYQSLKLVEVQKDNNEVVEGITAELYEIRKMLEIIADIMKKDFERR